MNPDTNQRKIVEVCRVVYTPADSHDGTVKGHRVLDCTPDHHDIDDGRRTPVDMAVYHLRDTLHIAGYDAASGHVPNPRYAPGNGQPPHLWPGPGTWFADESYQHPYRDEREETTAHLGGAWSDEERKQIWARVTGNMPVPAFEAAPPREDEEAR